MEGLRASALAAQRAGKWVDAEQSWRTLATLAVKVHGPRHEQAAEALRGLAGTLHMQRRYAEGAAVLRQALEIRREAFGRESLQAAEAERDFAIAAGNARQYPDAEAALRRAWAVFRKLQGEDSLPAARVAVDLAEVLVRTDRDQEAEPMLRDAVAAFQSQKANKDASLAVALETLGQLMNRQGRFVEATSMFTAAARADNLGPPQGARPHLLKDYVGLAESLAAQQRFAEAEQSLRYVIGEQARVWPSDALGAADLYRRLGGLRHAQGFISEAEGLFAKALELRRANGDETSAGYGVSLHDFAAALASRRRPEEAEPLLRQALAISAVESLVFAHEGLTIARG